MTDQLLVRGVKSDTGREMETGDHWRFFGHVNLCSVSVFAQKLITFYSTDSVFTFQCILQCTTRYTCRKHFGRLKD